MQALILMLDAAGNPAKWVTREKAAFYYAKGLVTWDIGEEDAVMHGGTNARTGCRSTLTIKPIISVAGKENIVHGYREPPVDRFLVFRRDRHLCAFCGQVFKERDLTLDHVIPASRGGPFSWGNLVSSCKTCNGRKDSLTPEEARMPLLYVPYAPNRHESFILANRVILADQMLFLLEGVPKTSRLHH
ncbi:MAG: HNH endonuclease [Deltaproteobacteria bacterium]